MDFKKLNLKDELIEVISELGYEVPTKVQQETIPYILQNNDVIVNSQTGTGKTAAYALPIIQMIDKSQKGVQALVICPTRELAMQVESEFIKFLKYEDGIKTACLYGGQDINKQMSAIRGNTKIVVGTPGRIIDHINRKSLWLNKVKNLVLDEADEMINMGFKEDIETILKVVNVDSNLHMFSATIDNKLREIAKNYMINPVEVSVESDTLTVENIKELAVELKVKMKSEATARFISMYNPEKAIVFCMTKKNVDMVTRYLKDKNYLVDGLHSDIMQSDRKKIINAFKNNDINILVATDVAARGIDVDSLDLVINYDLPYEPQYYVHRVGRTGRNGKEGVAISYFVGEEKQKLNMILGYTKSKIEYINIPRQEDIKSVSYKFEHAKVTDKLSKKENDETVKVQFNIGKNKNIKAKDILGSMAANTAIPKSAIGHIQVEDDYSVVVIPKFYLNEALNCMLDKEVKGVKITDTKKV